MLHSHITMNLWLIPDQISSGHPKDSHGKTRVVFFKKSFAWPGGWSGCRWHHSFDAELSNGQRAKLQDSEMPCKIRKLHHIFALVLRSLRHWLNVIPPPETRVVRIKTLVGCCICSITLDTQLRGDGDDYSKPSASWTAPGRCWSWLQIPMLKTTWRCHRSG